MPFSALHQWGAIISRTGEVRYGKVRGQVWFHAWPREGILKKPVACKRNKLVFSSSELILQWRNLFHSNNDKSYVATIKKELKKTTI